MAERRRSRGRVADWRLGPVIGRGAYSKVFVAYDDRERKVAVKQLLDTAASSESAALPGGSDAGALRDELVREIAIMRTLKHENVVRYLGRTRRGASSTL